MRKSVCKSKMWWKSYVLFLWLLFCAPPTYKVSVSLEHEQLFLSIHSAVICSNIQMKGSFRGDFFFFVIRNLTSQFLWEVGWALSHGKIQTIWSHIGFARPDSGSGRRGCRGGFTQKLPETSPMPSASQFQAGFTAGQGQAHQRWW